MRRRTRYLKEIATRAQLREAQMEMAIITEYAGGRLADDAAGAFSLDGLLSIVAPSGSVIDKIIGGLSTGIAAVEGIGHMIGVWRGTGSRVERGSASCGRGHYPVGHKPPVETVAGSRRYTDSHPHSKKICR